MAIDDQELEGSEPEDPSELVKHLRGLVKNQGKELSDLKNARRELAFVKAGIDTSTKLGQLFAKSFEGDVNDIEAIKAEAKELGILKDPSTDPATPPAEIPDSSTPQPPADSSAQERSSLANGATPDDGSGTDPRQTAMDLAQSALKQGAPWEVAAGGFINQLANAAARGDQRVIVPKGSSF